MNNICSSCGEQNDVAYDFYVKDNKPVLSTHPGAKAIRVCYQCDEGGVFCCAWCETTHKHEQDCYSINPLKLAA